MTLPNPLGLLGVMILTACTELSSTTQPAPSVVLEKDKLRVVIYLPDPERGYYRGPRFDWSGMINHAEYDSVIFWNEWNPHNDPLGDHDNATGPAIEFGMTSPLGFNEAKGLEGFIKIGVGVLQKPEDGKPYFFRHPYRVLDTGEWSVTISENHEQAIFRQKVQYREWGYEYSKTVRLSEQRLSINCRLENIGNNPIVTDVYNHNFLRPDARGFEPPIRIHFDRPLRIDPSARTADAIQLNDSGDVLSATKTITQSIWAPLLYKTHEPAKSFTLVKGKLQLTVSHDFEPSKYVLFALPEVISVEPFMDIQLLPGQHLAWTYDYQFQVDQ